MRDCREAGQRDELLASVRRLTRIVLDRLEQGSSEGTLDQGQVRMLGSIALRSLRLWREALGGRAAGGDAEQGLLEAEVGLARKLAGSEEKGEGA